MSDALSLVLDATGTVVRVAVGSPADVPVAAGETAISRDGAAADAWIGWVRAADGSWPDPNAPAPDTSATLAAYARAQSRLIEEGGVDVNGTRIATDRSSQGLIDRATSLFAADPSLTEVEFDTGVGTTVITLTKDQTVAVGIAVGRHVQSTFAKRAAALRGIGATPPTITTRAQVDAAFAGTA